MFDVTKDDVSQFAIAHLDDDELGDFSNVHCQRVIELVNLHQEYALMQSIADNEAQVVQKMVYYMTDVTEEQIEEIADTLALESTDILTCIGLK